MKRTDIESRQPPFTLDRTSRNTLVAQMADALRQAIVSGRYRPGEALPTVREWAKLLGVSMRVPEAVIPRLVKEGLVVARPRHGCIVAPRGAKIFRGHVLVVVPPGDHVRSANIMIGCLTRRLEEAGYLVSRSTAYPNAQGRQDFSRLCLALRQSVDLALFVYETLSGARCAKRLGIPFVTMNGGFVKGATGHITRNEKDALRAFAAGCAARGIRTAGVMEKDSPCSHEAALALAEIGIKVDTAVARVNPALPRIEGILTAARDAMCECLAGRWQKLPDLIHFTDDYLATGAVPVLLARGVRIPDDVRISTLANRGQGPVFPFPCVRLEYDPYAEGDLVADGILAYFKTGTFPGGLINAQRCIACCPQEQGNATAAMSNK